MGEFVFKLFAAFIFACGTVHLIEAVIFWYPIYRVSAVLKLVTAVVSCATVIVLVRVIPVALKLPSLAARNEELKSEVIQRQQTESELRLAKARLDALLSGTRSIVWTTDSSGDFVVPQISWERYTGQSWGEHQKDGWVNAIHEDDRAELLRRWALARTTQSKYQSHGRLWHRDSNSYRSIVAEGVPIFADGKTVSEWIGTITDIEEQQQAETALSIAKSELVRQNRELELIYEAAPVGMSLFDHEYRFIRINETLAKINGLSREEHIGHRVDELLPNLYGQIEPIFRRVFETGEPVLDTEILGITQATVDERTWLVSCYPLRVPQRQAGLAFLRESY